jgi:cyanate permease
MGCTGVICMVRTALANAMRVGMIGLLWWDGTKRWWWVLLMVGQLRRHLFFCATVANNNRNGPRDSSN